MSVHFSSVQLRRRVRVFTVMQTQCVRRSCRRRYSRWQTWTRTCRCKGLKFTRALRKRS